MDLGLLAGFAEGIKSGLLTYQDVRKRRQDEQNATLDRDAKLLKEGYQTDGHGGLIRTQEEQDLRDPNSEYSRRQVGLAKGLLKSSTMAPDEEIDQMTEGLSAHEIQNDKGLLKEFMKGQQNIQGRGLVNDRWREANELRKQELEIKRKRLGMAEDKGAEAAGNLFDKDPIIKQSIVQQNKIRQGMHTLETTNMLTPQLFSEIQADIATAIAQGGSHAASQEQKKEFSSLELDLVNLKQRLTNKPQDIGSPEVRQYLQDTMQRLDAAYSANQADRAKSIAGGRKYSHNSGAQQTLENKVKSFSKPKVSHEDEQAIEWAKSNPGDERAKKILEMHGVE